MTNNAKHETGMFPPLPEVLDALNEAYLERVESAESVDEYTFYLETQCGADDDSQPVEQYDGTLGVTEAFVDGHQGPVGQLQWNDNLSSIYDNPGNVSVGLPHR